MSIVSGIYGAERGAQATGEAAKTAADAQNNATRLQGQIFNKQIELQQPFYNVGKGAIPGFQAMINGGYNMKQSPAAQYQLQEGTKALNRSMAARGLSGSGNAINRLTQLNQSVAASDWNQQYQRILDALKLGTGASASMGQAGTTLGGQVQQGAQNLGNIATQQGQNMASLYAGLGGASANTAAVGVNAYKAFNAGSAANTGSEIEQLSNYAI